MNEIQSKINKQDIINNNLLKRKNYIDSYKDSGIEILSKRGKREKHFLQKDGTIIAKMYSDNIHFEKNGKFEDIDNRLIKIDDYYRNKKNIFNTFFKEKSCGELLKYELPEGYISFAISNCNEVPINVIYDDSQYIQKVKYNNIYDGVNLEYILYPTRVKENFIIYDNDINYKKISFIIKTNFDLKLVNNMIIASRNNNEFFSFETPCMLDSNNNISYDIKYNLNKTNDGYLLDLLFDTDWMQSPNTVYPIIIDPTISTKNFGNVYDTYIYQGDTLVDRNSQDILKAGVERNGTNDVINRTLIRFDLPSIGTGSQICEAYLNLIGYAIESENPPYYISKLVDIHRITTNWDENSANWNNMNDKFDDRIEVSFLTSRSWEHRYQNGNVITIDVIPYTSTGNITSLVKKWYTGTPNYGIMLKAHKEIYDSEMLPAFYSKNNSSTGEDPKPTLEVIYRNQNGLEGYMNYQSQVFSKGIVYENTYNGNLVALFNIGKTLNGKFPVNLNLIYNTNDVVLNKNCGLGTGYKFNLWQTIKTELIDENNYLAYEDEDGTIHYFQNIDGVFKDEDNLGMSIVDSDNYYTLTDKNKNTLKFIKNEGIGYLKEIENGEGNTVIINYNSNNLINKIIDGNNQEININYSNDKIIVTSQSETVTMNYNNEKITSIDYLDGNISFEYNTLSLISKITDIDSNSISFQYYDQSPYKIKKVSEYGVGNTDGANFSLEYGNKVTSLIDNNGRVTTISYNDYGNPVCTNNLVDKNNISNAYGTVFNYGEYEHYKNRIIANKIPIKHVNNLLKNISFEQENIYFDNSDNSVLTSISSDFSVSGAQSLKIVSSTSEQFAAQEISVEKGNYYTFSAYIKNSCNAKLILSYINSENNNVNSESTLINISEEFERYDVTIFYPNDAISDLMIKIVLIDDGTVYVDDIQLEVGEVANHFNYIENSGFDDGFGNMVCETDSNNPSPFQIVTLEDNHTKALKIKMDPEYDTHESMTFNVKGQAGDKYTLSFWYKNKGTFPITSGVISGSSVWLQALYTDPDDYHTQHCIPITNLNPNEDQWQFFSVSYVTESQYENFIIHFQQSGDANELFITNLSLFKSVCSGEYDYDSEGNLKKISINDNEKVSFHYDSNNQLISSKNTKGRRLMYEYDKNIPDRLINSLSEMGISSTLKFDADNNPIVETLCKKSIDGEIISGLYKIRLKGSDLYLCSSNGILLLKNKDECCNLWKIEKKDDYYSISHPIINNKYFSVNNSKLVLNGLDDTKTSFSLLRKENGSYNICSIIDNRYIKYDNGELTLSYKIEDDDDYEFYFETIDEQHFIEINSKYTDDGKFIKSKVDENFNELSYDINTETGLTTETINPMNQKSNYYYDEKNRLTSIVLNNKKFVNYRYNNRNYLDKIIYGSKEYNFTYDDFGNNQDLKIGNNITIVSNNYENRNGNLISTTYGNNHSINYTYDEFNRVISLEKMNGLTKFKYGNNGDLLKVINNDSELRFSYDLDKKLTDFISDNFKIKYKYDNSGNILNRRYYQDSFSEEVNYTFNNDDIMTSLSFDNESVNYEYDKLGRIKKININNILSNEYDYITNGYRTSMLLRKFKSNDNIYKYKYDKLNNITHIYCNDIIEHKYYYNDYNELIRDDDYSIGKTFKYKYDKCGNILFKRVYELNTNNLINNNVFEYNNQEWEDLLTKYNGENITYDTIGNPTNIGNDVILSWINGKELNSYCDGRSNISFKYDYTGTRISKTVNNVETKYYCELNKIIVEKTGNSVIYFLYDIFGSLIGFKLNGVLYYYVKNDRQDIIGILDNQGNLVVKYKYDSFGNHISILDANDNDITDENHVGIINPFRYRSYYYDKETNLYYLNSRYYNPIWGRFLNADSLLIQNSSLNGYNLFTYTDNNYVNNIDSNGNISLGLGLLVVAAVCLVCTACSKKKSSKKRVSKKKKTTTKVSNSGAIGGYSTKANSFSPSISAITTPSSIALPGIISGSAIDGPLPVADIIVWVLAIGAIAAGIMSSSSDLTQVIEDEAVDDSKNSNKPCTKAYYDSNIHDLVKEDRLTIEESIEVVRRKKNIWCDDHDSAFAVASEFPRHSVAHNHINGKNAEPGEMYYNHFHPFGGRKHVHIWFGKGILKTK